jgi:tetratricopeptide (TPR) repeat protein
MMIIPDIEESIKGDMQNGNYDAAINSYLTYLRNTDNDRPYSFFKKQDLLQLIKANKINNFLNSVLNYSLSEYFYENLIRDIEEIYVDENTVDFILKLIREKGFDQRRYKKYAAQIIFKLKQYDRAGELYLEIADYRSDYDNALQCFFRTKNKNKILETYQLGIEREVSDYEEDRVYEFAAKLSDQLGQNNQAIKYYEKLKRYHKAKRLKGEKAWKIPEFKPVDKNEYWKRIDEYYHRDIHIFQVLNDKINLFHNCVKLGFNKMAERTLNFLRAPYNGVYSVKIADELFKTIGKIPSEEHNKHIEEERKQNSDFRNARYLKLIGQYEEATSIYKEIIAKGDSKYYKELGAIAELNNRNSEAMDWYKKYFDEINDGEVKEDMARVALKLGINDLVAEYFYDFTIFKVNDFRTTGSISMIAYYYDNCYAVYKYLEDEYQMEKIIDEMLDTCLIFGFWKELSGWRGSDENGIDYLFKRKLFDKFDGFLEEIDELDYALKKYAETGMYERCEKIMRRISEIDNDNTDFWTEKIVEMYKTVGQPDQAKRVLEGVLQNNQKSQTEESDIVPEPEDQVETIKCHNCGSQMKPGKKFCTHCGSPLEEPTINECENCGAEIGTNELFCGECGHKGN